MVIMLLITILKSLYSPKCYREACNDEKGYYLRYLLLLMILINIPFYVINYYDYKTIKDNAPGIILRFPVMSLINGEMHIDRELPYFVSNYTAQPLIGFTKDIINPEARQNGQMLDTKPPSERDYGSTYQFDRLPIVTITPHNLFINYIPDLYGALVGNYFDTSPICSYTLKTNTNNDYSYQTWNSVYQNIIIQWMINHHYFNFAKYENTRIDPIKINNFVNLATSYIPICLYTVLVMIGFIIRLLQIMLFSTISMLIASSYQIEKSFQQYFRITMLATTPSILLSMNTHLMPYFEKHDIALLLISMLITIAYIIFGIWSNRNNIGK